MTEQTPLVAVCGLTTLDLIQYVDSTPGPDEKVQATAAVLDFGGPAANAAATAASLGVRTRLISALGDDETAALVRSSIEASGIEVCEADADAGWRLPVSSVVVDNAGRRSVVSSNALGSGAIAPPPDSLDAVQALLVDGHHLDMCVSVARSARRAGIPVLLDGGSWKTGLENLIDLVDAAVLSADFRTPDAGDALASDLWGARPVAVTHGPEPIAYRIGSRAGEVPVPEVRAVDTLGAGDVLHGAWLAFVGRHGLTESGFADGLAYAAEAASQSCSRPGLRPTGN